MVCSLRSWFLVVALALVATGCAPQKGGPWPPAQSGPDFWKALPPGQLALRKLTDPAMIPDFSGSFDDRVGLAEAIENSLNYLAKPSSEQFFPYGEITHARAVASLETMLEVMDQARTADEFNRMLRGRFDVYQSVGADDKGTVLFTGYYRPIFDARMQPDAEFRYPIHRRPAGLEKDPLTGRTLGRRTASGQLVPCYTRADIMAGDVMRGLELAYLRDPFEAYILTVQGSGKLRLGDGSFLEVGYTANNGYDYVSIGQMLLDGGQITQRELSLQGLIRYFNAHPEQIDRYLSQNPRYVFFDERPGGPWGSLNEAVIAYRSIATDKDVFPRACLSFLTTKLPARIGGEIVTTNFRGFALDQDTGGAIRAAGRCDIFMGTGDEAGALAGRTFTQGQLYYLFVRPEAAVAHAR